MDRRSFIYQLSLLSAGIAMSCRRPEQDIFPAVLPIEKQEFGAYDYYRTYLPSENGLYKLLIKVFEGKPIQFLPQEIDDDANTFIDAPVLNEIYNLYNSNRFWKSSHKEKSIKREDIIDYCSEFIDNKLSKLDNAYIFIENRNSPALERLVNIISSAKENVIFIDKYADDVRRFMNLEFDSSKYVDSFEKSIQYSELTGHRTEIQLLSRQAYYNYTTHKVNVKLAEIFKSKSLLLSSYNLNKLDLDSSYINDFIYISYVNSNKSLINIPKSHFLEAWADGQTLFKEYGVQQPVVKPLNPDSFTDIELIFDVFKNLGVSDLQKYDGYYDFVKDDERFSATLSNANEIIRVSDVDERFKEQIHLANDITLKASNIDPLANKADKAFTYDNPYDIFKQKKDDNFAKNFFQKISLAEDSISHNNYEFLGHRWGLLIDVDKCAGCNTCIAACRIENNTPAPEYQNYDKDRDMDWLSIIKTKNLSGKTIYIPYMCQHCENAPCESACPVNAATHSPEGLSETIYNRCVGTRYCMAACQYKVRRFNFRNNYIDFDKRQRARLNPEVTVRSRGVVEKCSLCVQRLNEFNNLSDSEKKAKKNHTACSEVCPLKAIKLVDLNSEEFKQIKNENKDNMYQIIVNSATKPSIFYIMRD